MGKREDNARQTRQKLLDTANRLIVKNGYEDVSVDSIVQESGIAKGTFYNYFQHKEDLIFELSKARFSQVIDEETFRNSKAVEVIQSYLVNFITVIYKSNVELTRQWVRYISTANTSNQQKWQLDVESLQRLLERLVTDQRLRSDTPVASLATVLLTQMYGVILAWCIAPNSVNPVQSTNDFCERQVPLMLDQFLID